MKIRHAVIGPYPEAWTDPMPKVVATLEDGNEVELFHFYPDEISFLPSEFVGLTIGEAHALKMEKDVRYLQS
jgi:hypothetical protein